ncbi:hypothetical protein [Blastococcus deserti]|uniref:Dolichyl-phosphate-mannose-protein mannosyltransferase n=1 Tax=Blastococcus deserti TaxID=2259033 RepID=A0ABW4X6X0_9ACTN
MTTATPTRALTMGWRRLRALFERPVVAWSASALVVVLSTAATIVMRLRVQSPLGQSPYDGQLYIRQARSILGQHWLDGYTNLTLVKVPGYSIFIAVCNWLGIPLKAGEQLVAILAALLVALCLLVVTKRLAVAVPAFVACAFSPIYLSTWSADFGRDALFASISVILVTSLFLTSYYLVFGRAFGWALATAGLAGLSLAGYVLIREEGVTVVPTALVAVGALPLMHALRHRPWREGGRRWAGRAARRVVPSALILAVGMLGPVGIVLAANKSVYGIATTSELASGAFMDAYAQWQRVEAGEPKFRVPINEEQREAVYEVSPTAGLLAPELENRQNPWRFSGCYTVPNCDYQGGWVTWAIRDAAAAAGAFGSAAESKAFFEKLGREIADACDSGELNCRIKLPSAVQPLTRISFAQVVESFVRLTGSTLSSRNAFQHINEPFGISPEARAEFVAVAPEVPANEVEAALQRMDFRDHEWQYKTVNVVYWLLFPVAVVLGVVLLGALLASRRGRATAGPLTALGVALLFAAVSRLGLISIVDAADYDADQSRYLIPAHALLLAFAVVAIVQGLSALDLKRLGAVVRGSREDDRRAPADTRKQAEDVVSDEWIRPLGSRPIDDRTPVRSGR